jgi:hypothetical protein
LGVLVGGGSGDLRINVLLKNGENYKEFPDDPPDPMTRRPFTYMPNEPHRNFDPG